VSQRIVFAAGVLACLVVTVLRPGSGGAWYDETHLAIAKAAGWRKWYHAAGADIAKLKLGEVEQHNHYANNACGARITPAAVFAQAERYDRLDPQGHLYGAILGALRGYRDFRARGLYADYHLAYAVHYLGDLSQPLHHIPHNDYNRRHHAATDGIVDRGALRQAKRIALYPIAIASEEDLAREIARIAQLSLDLACTLQREDRILAAAEAWVQLGHSASLLRAVLDWLEREGRAEKRAGETKDPG